MGDAKKTEMEMETVEKKEASGSVGFRELRDDLFNEAANLVSEDPSIRIAIFVTPPSTESDGSTHSFAHPSVESVVETFLEDKCPVPYDSMNPEQLAAAYEKLTRLRSHMILQLEAKERGQSSGNHQDKAGP
ncbi:unnamed protein product [Arabis nemorensis]|uniref:MADS-box domain-containing protein n=1 Tax=Arabis nemorensis TaxID=586526 RepID=A0A565B9A1_9BRAS|nr:unnamed protein product [Arabis nemorensis]